MVEGGDVQVQCGGVFGAVCSVLEGEGCGVHDRSALGHFVSELRDIEDVEGLRSMWDAAAKVYEWLPRVPSCMGRTLAQVSMSWTWAPSV